MIVACPPERRARPRSPWRERAPSGGPLSPPAPAAGDDVAVVREARARNRRVRRDHPVELRPRPRPPSERVELGVREIGRDLQEQRHRGPGGAFSFARAPSRSVRASSAPCMARRSFVFGDETLTTTKSATRARGAEAREVVGDGRVEASSGTARDLPIDTPTGTPAPPRPSPRANRAPRARRALVREAEPVDERAVVAARRNMFGRRVGLLRLRGHRPELEVPEAERRRARGRVRVLVEAAGEPEGRREVEPQGRHDQRGSCGARRARAEPRSGRDVLERARAPPWPARAAASGGRANRSGADERVHGGPGLARWMRAARRATLTNRSLGCAAPTAAIAAKGARP